MIMAILFQYLILFFAEGKMKSIIEKALAKRAEELRLKKSMKVDSAVDMSAVVEEQAVEIVFVDDEARFSDYFIHEVLRKLREQFKGKK